MSFIENFHFLRPLWLIALIGLFLIPNILRLYGNSGSAWKNICDSHLLDVLLTHQKARTAKLSIAALVAAYILSILALSGPTWERMPSQGATGGDNTVFVLDMGVDMGAGDVNPSRLDRAKYKLYDLLKKIKGDRAALVLFDNEGYMVSPLSEDLSVIENIIPTLDLSVMPGNGASIIEKGISEAVNLLESAKAGKGRIIVLSGAGASSAVNALPEVRKAADKGHIVSVLAVGTEGGAPAPSPEGNFYTDAQGRTILFKTGLPELAKLASAGNGGFAKVSTDDSDLYQVLLSPLSLNKNIQLKNVDVDEWKDMGVYLIIPVILLFLFAFRRGFIAVIALFIMNPSVSSAGVWEDLWLNPSQQAMKAIEKGEYKEAGKKFSDPSWKGYAQYKAGEYPAAVSSLSGLSDVTSLYNLGNAKAYSGDIDGAISAYEAALKIAPEHEDANYNLEYLKREQERQKQHQQNKLQQEQPKQQKNPDDKNDDSNEDNRHEEERQSSGSNDPQKDGSFDDKEKDTQKEDSGMQDEKPKEELSKEELEKLKAEYERQQEEKAAAEPKEEEQNQPQPSEMSEEEQSDIQMLNRVQEDKGGLLKARLKRIYQEKRGDK